MGCGSARLCESKNLRSSFTSLCASWALVRFYYEAGSIVLEAIYRGRVFRLSVQRRTILLFIFFLIFLEKHRNLF